MITNRRTHLFALGGLLIRPSVAGFLAEPDFSKYSDIQKEMLLRDGVIVSTASIDQGVTKPIKAQIRLKDATHAAQIQTINRALPDFFGEDGTVVHMYDSYRFNVAAYRIDRLIKLNMVAVAVARRYNGKPAAFSWWVDDVKGDELQRIEEKWTPPDPEAFERQRALTRVFDELIINIDRNSGNLLITRSWDLALIDHSRSFNPYHNIRNRSNLTRCSRALLASMSALTVRTVTAAVQDLLTGEEIAGLIARRDRIVEFFKERGRREGEENVFF